jgi:hypothetical protein
LVDVNEGTIDAKMRAGSEMFSLVSYTDMRPDISGKNRTIDKTLTPLAICGVNIPALVMVNPRVIPINSFKVGTKAVCQPCTILASHRDPYAPLYINSPAELMLSNDTIQSCTGEK